MPCSNYCLASLFPWLSQVTTCTTTADALTRLNSGDTYDVLLADHRMVSGKTRECQQLLDSCKGVPCILMAESPSPQDILAGRLTLLFAARDPSSEVIGQQSVQP